MATTSTSQAHDASHQPTEFELRRSALVGRIGDSLEQVLQQINALNRSLEGIIEIGNEFASVEALWSQFESVMGMPADNPGDTATAAATDNANDDTVTANTRESQTGGRSRGDEDDDETGTEQDDTITPR